MSELSAHRVVLCTCPDGKTAERIASVLVDGRLAACVNILPGIRSVYRWEREVQNDEELLLFIKTRTDRYPQVEQAIRNAHPYDVPEILSLAVDTGLADYLDWLDDSVAPDP